MSPDDEKETVQSLNKVLDNAEAESASKGQYNMSGLLLLPTHLHGSDRTLWYPMPHMTPSTTTAGQWVREIVGGKQFLDEYINNGIFLSRYDLNDPEPPHMKTNAWGFCDLAL